jgi:hypothetical protein
MSKKSIESLTVPQLKQKLKKEGIAIPKSGTGSNGNVIKADLIKALKKSQGRTPKKSVVGKKKSSNGSKHGDAGLRETLPSEISREIALRTDISAIANLCRTDRKFGEMCDDLLFWRNYFNGDSTKFFELIVHLFKEREYNLLLFLWQNTETIKIEKDNKMYQYLLQEADKVKNNDLLLAVWKFAPQANRSYFHEDVVEKLNKFFKTWGIAPRVGYDADDWYFLRHDDDFDYLQYSDLKKPIKEWEKLKDMILFTGSFYQLATESDYRISTRTLDDVVDLELPSIWVTTRDKISRSHRWNVEVKVVDILKHIAYIGYNPMNLATEEAGVINSIEIDKKAKYPTLLVDFESD